MKRKPHNQNKRLITQSIIAMRNLALTMKLSEVDKGVDVINYKTSKPEAVGQSIAQALDRTALKWAILLVVNAIERNGKTKTLTKWTRLAAPYKHSALTEWLRVEHQAMIDDCKGRCEVVDAGWVAVPAPPAFVDDLTEQILIDNLLLLLEDNPAQHLISRRDTALNSQGAHQ
jgi:hypothetical protein